MHGEYDEKEGHEVCDKRLTAIADASGCGADNVYVFRVMAYHDTTRELCKRYVVNKNHVYFQLTAEGHSVVQETAVVVRRILKWISQGLPPNDAEGRPRKVYINSY
jgi:hypothetical protein